MPDDTPPLDLSAAQVAPQLLRPAPDLGRRPAFPLKWRETASSWEAGLGDAVRLFVFKEPAQAFTLPQTSHTRPGGFFAYLNDTRNGAGPFPTLQEAMDCCQRAWDHWLRASLTEPPVSDDLADLLSALAGLLAEEPLTYEGHLEAKLFVSSDALATAQATLARLRHLLPA